MTTPPNHAGLVERLRYSSHLSRLLGQSGEIYELIDEAATALQSLTSTIAGLEVDAERMLLRPIDSAPKDRTSIIGWSKDRGFRETSSRLFGLGSVRHAEDPTARYWEWDEPMNNWTAHWEPTHWMPMPAPPAAISRARG